MTARRDGYTARAKSWEELISAGGRVVQIISGSISRLSMNSSNESAGEGFTNGWDPEGTALFGFGVGIGLGVAREAFSQHRKNSYNQGNQQRQEKWKREGQVGGCSEMWACRERRKSVCFATTLYGACRIPYRILSRSSPRRETGLPVVDRDSARRWARRWSFQLDAGELFP